MESNSDKPAAVSSTRPPSKNKTVWSMVGEILSCSEANMSDEGKSLGERPNVEEKLKETFVKHGISMQNEDSLHRLLRDKEFKDLLKTRLDNDDSSDTDASEVRMTRSRVKEVMRNSPFKASLMDAEATNRPPKFTEIPLLDDDDDDEDEEYKPLESSFENETAESHMVAPTVSHSVVPLFPHATETIDPFIEECESHMDEQALACTSSHDTDLISKRTRSKHSLQSTTIDVLEAAFQPPDTTSDMYETDIGDYDWQQWLVDLMKDSGPNNRPAVVEEEDDPIADPDFSVAPGQEVPDKEDMRDDLSVQVSKKELNSLLYESDGIRQGVEPTLLYSTQASSSLDESFCIPEREKGAGEPCTSKSKTSWAVVSDNLSIPYLRMSEEQVETLRQQMQQHVQLLAQTNVLCRNQKHVKEFVEESSLLLSELRDIGLSQMQKLGVSSSAAIPFNLEEALALTKRIIPPSAASVRLLKMEKIKGHVSVPTAAGEVIAHSRVFMYKELLPMSAPSRPDFVHKNAFRPAEDALLTLGTDQMSGFPNHIELISQHILPTKTSKQIQSRMRNVVYCRNHKDNVNPIKKYHTCGILPKPLNNVMHVNAATAQKPIDMEGHLPNWLVALQPLYVPKDTIPQSVGRESTAEGVNMLKPGSVVQCDPVVRNSVPIAVTSTPVRALMVPYFPLIQQAELLPAQNLNSQGNSPVNTLLNLYGQPRRSPTKILPRPPDKISPGGDALGPPAPTCLITSSNQPLLSATGPCPGQFISKLFVEQPALPSLEENCDGMTDTVGQTDKEAAGESEKESVPSTDYFFPSNSSSDEDNDTFGAGVGCTSDQNMKNKDDADLSLLASEDDCLSDSLSSPNHCTQKKDGCRENKSIKVRFSKTEEGAGFPPFGGYLVKVHPRLRGRKTKTKSKEARALRNTARSIKSLEEDTVVQLDPNRLEKEQIFATGYHIRVAKALAGHPEIYNKFLDTLIKYGEGTRPVTELYYELSVLLSDWPQLVQGFAPFLMPEQAHECGLDAGQAVYARARKYLRQLEIQFNDKPDHLEKILNVFHTIASTAIYSEEQMLRSILNLLKDHPFLQDEFLSFLDEQHPPKVLLEEDFEEIDLTDDLIRDPTLSQFEQVTILAEDVSADAPVLEEPVFKKVRKRGVSLAGLDGMKPVPKPVAFSENKENVHPEATSADADDEGAFNTDYDTEEEMEIQGMSEEAALDRPPEEHSSTSLPPDITVISEDAISASPFKRIAEEELIPNASVSRPITPTGIRSEDTQSFPEYHEPHSSPVKSSSEDMMMIPATPNGKGLTALRSSGSGTEFKTPSSQEQNTENLTQDFERVQSHSEGTNAEQTSKFDGAENPEATDRPNFPKEIDNSDNSETQHVPNAQNAKENVLQPPEHKNIWTREIDTDILTTYQSLGPSPESFSVIAQRLGCQAVDIEQRLCMLLSLLTEEETDNETTSQESEGESETLESDV